MTHYWLDSGIPLGFWLTFRNDFGLPGLWVGLTSALVYSSVTGLYVCNKTDWKQEVNRASARLSIEDTLPSVPVVA